MAKAVWINMYICLLAVALADTAVSTPVAISKEAATNDDSNVAKVRKARQAGACGCDMTVYDDSNYGGRSLLVKQQNADFANDYFSDRIESARIVGNCSWLMYQHAGFNKVNSGHSHLLAPSDYPSYVSWGGKGNRITSARALPPDGTDAIVLFQHAHFHGRMLVLYNSDSHLPSQEFNDQLSSFIIIGGNWKLFSHSNYQGSSATFNGPHEYPTLPNNVANDYITSVRKEN